jgi:dienelactone hydrolase
METIERVTFSTADGKKLVGTLYLTEGEKSLILLHQLNHDRTSYDAFAKELMQQGWTLLAIDFRGHGESEGNWKSFSDKEFIAMLLDAEAAASLLGEREKIVKGIVGASIGANTAFRFGSVKRVPAILLSPGLLYKGIDINDITSSAPVLTIVSEGDRYSYTSSKELAENNMLGRHELYVHPGSEHGTYLLAFAEIKDKIVAFLNK